MQNNTNDENILTFNDPWLRINITSETNYQNIFGVSLWQGDIYK